MKTLFDHKLTFSKAKKLIEKGADVNEINDYGDTPLHIIAYYSKAKVVDLLIKNGADITVKNNYGNVPLVYAVRSKNIKKVRLLSNLSISSKILGSILTTAIYNNNTEIVDFILSIVVVNMDLEPTYFNKFLYFANNAKIISSLLSIGANANARTNEDITPLHSVTDIEALKVLIENGADINIKDSEGNSLLFTAVHKYMYEFANYLIEKGARF